VKKYAYFVEGQTERIFLEHFLTSYLTYPTAISDSKKIIGDNIVTIRSNSILEETEYYFLVYDVSSDERVASKMIENAKNMIENQNYEMIFGLRDLYPSARDKKCQIVNKIKGEFKKTGLGDKLKLILAIMEIETWLLSDKEVFRRINETLTIDYIDDQLGIDLSNGNPEDFDKPSSIIAKIFGLVGDRYEKTEDDCYKIISRIDFCNLCFSEDILSKVLSLKYFLEKLNEAIN
jgi:hypothetical protein